MEDIVAKLADADSSCTLLLKDSVACSGDFMVHYFLRRLLVETDTRVVLLGLANSFAHYSRVARRQGCSLQGWRDEGRFAFVALGPDAFESSREVGHQTQRSIGSVPSEAAAGDTEGHLVPGPLPALYSRIKDAVKSTQVADNMPGGGARASISIIIIDDVSILEVVAGGVQYVVLDFLNYCQALSCGKRRCSMVLLTHGDIYKEPPDSYMGLELEHVSDIVISVEPLSTGLAADVHGQLTVLRRARYSAERHSSQSDLPRFQFRILENAVEFFLPGQLRR